MKNYCVVLCSEKIVNFSAEFVEIKPDGILVAWANQPNTLVFSAQENEWSYIFETKQELLE